MIESSWNGSETGNFYEIGFDSFAISALIINSSSHSHTMYLYVTESLQ